MRPYFLFAAALALLAGDASAQQRSDSAARTDSVARRDSVLAERERARIRRDRVRTRGTRPVDSAGARRSRRPSWRAELGAGLWARYAQDPNGADVSSRFLRQPLLGAGAVWDVGARTALSLTARAALGPLRLESNTSGDSWDGGTVKHADLLAAVEWAPRAWGALRAGVGAAWLRGPSDLVPFRHNNDTALHPAGTLGASARVSRARPLSLFLDLHGIRYGGSTIQDPIREPGTVTRVILGVRYGR